MKNRTVTKGGFEYFNNSGPTLTVTINDSPLGNGGWSWVGLGQGDFLHFGSSLEDRSMTKKEALVGPIGAVSCGSETQKIRAP
jgi:hypothetical protein